MCLGEDFMPPLSQRNSFRGDCLFLASKFAKSVKNNPIAPRVLQHWVEGEGAAVLEKAHPVSSRCMSTEEQNACVRYFKPPFRSPHGKAETLFWGAPFPSRPYGLSLTRVHSLLFSVL